MAIFLFMVRALEAQTEKLQTAIEKISATKVATGANECDLERISYESVFKTSNFARTKNEVVF